MQAISPNAISQGQHGATKAVDYRAVPDPNIYAPENGVIDSYQQRGSGKTNAGNTLRMKGAAGLHQFAHCETSYVKPGQAVVRGQRIAKMGYTGYVLPPGPAGRHCHWWIYRSNGTYVYPPNLINQGFIIYNPAPPTSSQMPPVGSGIQLIPVQTRNTFRAGTTTPAGSIRVTNNTFVYMVRGYDPKYPGRIIINSASAGGNGVALALYYTNGTIIPGWKRI